MFARHVSMKLKGNSVLFSRVIEEEVLPLLREQKGFRDEITFVNPERSIAIGVSLWETKEDAETYSRTEYPKVTRALSEVIEGTPTVETFDVANSTMHRVAAKTA